MAMVSNFFMRLMWTFTISPGSIGIVMNPTGFAAILAAVEIVRRAQWNLFRLENEQLNNVGKYRATNVQVPPSDQDTYNANHIAVEKENLSRSLLVDLPLIPEDYSENSPLLSPVSMTPVNMTPVRDFYNIQDHLFEPASK